jgi:hypothetical protein
VEARSQNWYLGWSFRGEGENPGVRRVVDVEILFQQLPKQDQKENETPPWLLVSRPLSSQANIKTHTTPYHSLTGGKNRGPQNHHPFLTVLRIRIRAG